MTVETEVREYLNRTLKELSTKSRDIDLILYRYGFGDAAWPTLEVVAEKFNVGKSAKRRAERPRQIIEEKFRDSAEVDDFPSLVRFTDLLNSKKVLFFDELLEECLNNGLLDERGNPVSLLWLLHSLGSMEAYQAYFLDLQEVSPASVDRTQDILIAEHDTIESLKKPLQGAKVIPGKIGIAKLEYLSIDNEEKGIDLEALISILKRSPDSWFHRHDGNEYYLFESRRNALVTSLRKIKAITEHENINVLTDVLFRSLKRTQPPRGRQFPPKELIKKYLLSSKHTKINGDIVSINTDRADLPPVDEDVVNFLRENAVDDSPAISEHLDSLGYDESVIIKAVFSSPLIHVDESEGRRGYKFRLVGTPLCQDSCRLL